MSPKVNTKPVGITELVLRDAHQSLFATRMRIDDMLPIAEELDQIGYWSMESWGGATFDSCIRYLGEDPWDRIREIKKVMPNTPQQMLLRGQNLLGYRHYGDDVVRRFIDRCADNGVGVFRIFDAMNDMRNIETAIKAAIKVGKHAQGAMSYTLSPVHNTQTWLDMARRLEDMGVHSICIKDMAGLLKPYVAEELVGHLKESINVPIAMHCHATTGFSTATIVKAVEAGIDMVDTSISSMSLTYGHSPTETVCSILEDTPRRTGLDLSKLEEVSAYFRTVRPKYKKWEGSLKGVDSRILVSQVPGGMLTNMESQLKEQGAGDRLDEVLVEIPKVREDLGFIPLVTPTSQIVGTQAVINVLTGERYKTITKETAGVLKGEYGATAAPVNSELQQGVLEGAEVITCRPADLIDPELERLTSELRDLSAEHDFDLAENEIDDVLTYALFPEIGLKFLKNRHNTAAFEPAPVTEEASVVSQAQTNNGSAKGQSEKYNVHVDGKNYSVIVSPDGVVADIRGQVSSQSKPISTRQDEQAIPAPLAGNIFKVKVKVGDSISEGQVLLILEAMKMETEIVAPGSGSVTSIDVKEGDSVTIGDTLLSLA